MSAYNQKLCITSAFPWHLSMQHESGAGTEAVFLGSQQVSYSRSQEKQNGSVWSFPSSVGQHKPTNKNNYISYIYTVYSSSIPKNSQSNLLIMYLSQDLILLLLWLQQQSLLQTLQRLWYFFLKGMQRLVPNPPAWGKKISCCKIQQLPKDSWGHEVWGRSWEGATASWEHVLSTGTWDITSKGMSIKHLLQSMLPAHLINISQILHRRHLLAIFHYLGIERFGQACQQ